MADCGTATPLGRGRTVSAAMGDTGIGTSARARTKGRGKARATLELIETSREILEEIQPASVRAVCYRLFTMGLIPNMSKNSTNKVSTQLTWAREQCVIPWEWVVDETRDAERINAWTNPDQIIRAAVHGYRRNYWQEQAYRVEVWSEKGTVRGTLAPVFNELGVTFRVMHGFASATAINAIADESNYDDGRPLVALYVGDFDPSGMFMSEADLPDRLNRYGATVNLKRVALTVPDLRGLPSFDVETKRGDARYEWFLVRYGRQCWELDAMSPNLLRERVRESIRTFIDDDAWMRAVEIEQVEIDSMHDFHAAWKSRISGQAAK